MFIIILYYIHHLLIICTFCFQYHSSIEKNKKLSGKKNLKAEFCIEKNYNDLTIFTSFLLHPKINKMLSTRQFSEQDDFKIITDGIRERALKRKWKGDKTSLLRNLEQYINDYNAGLFTLEYKYRFFDLYVDNRRMPHDTIPLIFEELKRCEHLRIPSYKREETRDSSFNILKSCKIYNQTFGKFEYFAFLKSDRSRIIPNKLNQKNETHVFSPEEITFIVDQWKDIKTNQIKVQNDIFTMLLRSNIKISDAAMFQFEQKIYIIPFKRISKRNTFNDPLHTQPIPIVKTEEEDEVNLIDSSAFIQTETSLNDFNSFENDTSLNDSIENDTFFNVSFDSNSDTLLNVIDSDVSFDQDMDYFLS